MDFFLNLFKSKKSKLIENRANLGALKRKLMLHNEVKLEARKNKIPLIAAQAKLQSIYIQFSQKRKRLNDEWEQAYLGFSWWNKIKYPQELDLSDLDGHIVKAKKALDAFNEMYSEQIVKIEQHFTNLKQLSESRLLTTYKKFDQALENDQVKEVNNTSLHAAWIAGMSIPVSIVDDLFSAEQVFNSLRAVNSNFEAMSNLEIWWETLWMSPQSYAGLVSLTKGAYFEQLVANDTGGLLHEHFNHPDTDITIDGIEMQIKATDSISYINSVDDDIPVITTSEVALSTDAIDSGFRNEDISNTVGLAMGGSVVDAKDTSIDAILTGVGSLGIFATMQGINHASTEYEKGVDGAEAIFKGAGVAIEGTAKGLVDASEMAYNVAMSRPSRFVGRTLLKGFKKLDDKMMEAGSKERN